MSRAVRPALDIPPSTPAHSPIQTGRSPAQAGRSPVQTGRPPMWTKSAQRKMSRLYVYTTLPLEKIIKVVHASSSEPSPGRDSANKKLSSLFDKEPRWLHPRTDTDMGRRIDQLGKSKFRMPPASEIFPFPRRAHSFSEPPPFTNNPYDLELKPEPGRSPAMLEVPAFGPFASAWTSDVNLNLQLAAEQPSIENGSLAFGYGEGFSLNSPTLDDLLRCNTARSTSTDKTSGSVLQRILCDYSDSYVDAVRQLVRRFTCPSIPRRSASPMSDMGPNFHVHWTDDEDAPQSFREGPLALPGDFLHIDIRRQQTWPCFDNSEDHLHRWCMCYAIADISSSPWVYPNDLSRNGCRILQHGANFDDASTRDAFNNTVLHFLAARAPVAILSQVLLSGACASILNERNSAGQTFAHVVSQEWLTSPDNLRQLLQFLISQNFALDARDHYGRNFFHILLAAGVDSRTVVQFVSDFDPNGSRLRKRDAFEVVPGGNSAAPSPWAGRSSAQMMDEPDASYQKEARLIADIRASHEDPSYEDDDGRNGIHCLAAATLSKRSLFQKQGLLQGAIGSSGGVSDRQSRGGRSASDPGNELDSSKERLALRLRTLGNLLDVGVDPNQYDLRGNTPLMAFAAELPEDDDYKTGPDILELLITRGANVHARNRAGETALHIAVRCGRKLAVRTLVKHGGANVHVRDAQGRSLLDVADVKIKASSEEDTRRYAHFQACRAWLSGQGRAVQSPTVLEEWGAVSPS